MSASLLGQYRGGAGGLGLPGTAGWHSRNAFKRHFAGAYERRTCCTGVPVKRPIIKCVPLIFCRRLIKFWYESVGLILQNCANFPPYGFSSCRVTVIRANYCIFTHSAIYLAGMFFFCQRFHAFRLIFIVPHCVARDRKLFF